MRRRKFCGCGILLSSVAPALPVSLPSAAVQVPVTFHLSLSSLSKLSLNHGVGATRLLGSWTASALAASSACIASASLVLVASTAAFALARYSSRSLGRRAGYQAAAGNETVETFNSPPNE